MPAELPDGVPHVAGDRIGERAGPHGPHLLLQGLDALGLHPGETTRLRLRHACAHLLLDESLVHRAHLVVQVALGAIAPQQVDTRLRTWNITRSRDYSCLRASMALMRSARLAGTMQATSANAASISAPPPNDAMSSGSTP